MNVTVFLLIAGAASARHVLDVKLNNHDINGDVMINRRNIEYIRQNPESTPYVNSDLRQTDKSTRTKTNQQFVHSTGKYIEQNYEESVNNISYEENDHRLRTNAYTTEPYRTTEYIVEDGYIFTNIKEQNYIAERNLTSQGVLSAPVYTQGTQKGGIIKSNEPKSKVANRPCIKNNQERRPENNKANKNPQNEKTSNITNHKKEPVNLPETVLIQPLPTEEIREGNERLPKTNTDEQIWVWGTERTNMTSTEPGSLDDRAAFTGDRCPTGEAKVKGVCVEKH